MQTRSAYKPGPCCPHCGAPMQMLDSVPWFAGRAELQTFECRLCGLTVTEAAAAAALATAIPLAPR